MYLLNHIVSETDTLESLKDKINALNYNVVASVIGAGDGTFTLVLKSQMEKPSFWGYC